MAIVATSKSEVLLAAIRELAEYRGEDPVATAFNVGNSFFATNEIWRAVNPKMPAEIMQHYRTCKPQVEQQVFATYGIPGEVALRERIEKLPIGPEHTVLDFGAGIGSQLLPFLKRGCSCSHVDVGGVMMDYAAWRYRRAMPNREGWGGGAATYMLDDDYMHVGIRGLDGGRLFDLVICTEVIEHVPDPEALVERIARYVKPGGLLVATTSFHNDDDMIPMHLNVDKYSDETFMATVFPRHGLVKLEGEDYIFRK